MAYLGGTVLVIGIALALNGSWLVAGAIFLMTLLVVELYALAPLAPGSQRAEETSSRESQLA